MSDVSAHHLGLFLADALGLGLVKFDVGSRWLLDVTLDGGKQGVTRNLEPDLPMFVRY